MELLDEGFDFIIVVVVVVIICENEQEGNREEEKRKGKKQHKSPIIENERRQQRRSNDPRLAKSMLQFNIKRICFYFLFCESEERKRNQKFKGSGMKKGKWWK